MQEKVTLSYSDRSEMAERMLHGTQEYHNWVLWTKRLRRQHEAMFDMGMAPEENTTYSQKLKEYYEIIIPQMEEMWEKIRALYRLETDEDIGVEIRQPDHQTGELLEV